MEEAKFIYKEKPENSGLDFDFLRAEGVHLVQKLTGAFWTDYNEHDPGVTILEQVAYALTEISYRAQFDIQDILHVDSDKQSQQSFFSPDSVLPCNALTIDDYRKLLFDSVFQIKNVWLFPVDETVGNFNGLYNVLIDTDSTISKEAVEKAAYAAYNQNRNLCEDIASIEVLSYVDIHLDVNIELTGDKSLEEVMGEIFYAVDELLCPEIKFYSLEELLKEGYELKDIFDGPLLKHGFVKTEDLPAKTNLILVSDIMKVIMQLDGVSSVKKLQISLDGKEPINEIRLEANQLTRLAPIDKDEHKVIFSKGVTSLRQTNIEEAGRILNELKSGNKRVYRLNEKTMEMPSGNTIDLGHYYSLQNQFPEVYGVGLEGISGRSSAKRKGQAKQLKGYLMLFEQVIANAFAQLEHTKDLLSIGGLRNKSYFSQPLDSVPGAEHILKKPSTKKVTPYSPEESTLDYHKGLDEIMTLGEDHFDRIHRLLDYLLALHGEEYGNYLNEFNYYYGEDEFQEYLIKNKTFFLRFIPFINNGRFKGRNYMSEDTEVGNASGLEVKVSLLLGLNAFLNYDGDLLNYQKGSLLKEFDQQGLKLIGEEVEGSYNGKSVWFTNEVITEKGELVDDEEVDLSSLTDERKNSIMQKSPIIISETIKSAELERGLDIENYRVGILNEKLKSTSAVYHINGSTNKWLELGKFRKVEEAEQAVLLHIQLFQSLNVSAEGLHLMEHISLRPHPSEPRFGLYLLNEKGERVLGSKETFTFEEREEVAHKLLGLPYHKSDSGEEGKKQKKKLSSAKSAEYLTDKENYRVEIDNDREFEIHFAAEALGLHLVSLKANMSVEKTHEEVNALVKHFSDNRNPIKTKLDFFVRHSENGPILSEDFLSQRLSIFLPDWTVRFRNPEFQAITEEVIFEQKPAMISASINWLGYEQMKEFEGLYTEFCSLKSKHGNQAYLEEAYLKSIDELSKFVYDSYERQQDVGDKKA